MKTVLFGFVVLGLFASLAFAAGSGDNYKEKMQGVNVLTGADAITVEDDAGVVLSNGIEEIAISPEALEVTEPGKAALPYALEAGQKINAEIEGAGMVFITRNASSVVIEANGVQARTTAELQVREKKLYLAEKLLSILPDQARAAVENQLRASVREMSIEENGATIEYRVRFSREARLLWLLPVNVEGEATVDGATGVMKEGSGPWYGFLLTE
ncbi:MAG: hypothetical protein WC607_02730 [Candidatus Micrarchaeia archaeon]